MKNSNKINKRKNIINTNNEVSNYNANNKGRDNIIKIITNVFSLNFPSSAVY